MIPTFVSSEIAMTLAARGALWMSASSPKNSPGPIWRNMSSSPMPVVLVTISFPEKTKYMMPLESSPSLKTFVSFGKCLTATELK